MKLGQIPENVYNRSVIKEIELRNNIKGGVVYKETCAFFDDANIYFSECKNASLKELMGKMAVYSSVNELLARGAKPEAININMLMPHRFAEEKLKIVMNSLNEVAGELNVQIATFTGEMLNELNEAVLSVNAIGHRNKEAYNIEIDKIRKNKISKDIVITKWVGMAGTCIIADNKREELLTRFSASYVDGMEELKNYMSIEKDMEAINCYNKEKSSPEKAAVSICIPLSKGGIYKSLWDIGEKCDCGLVVELKQIPIKQETVEICNYYDLNPYELYSEGALLILTDNGQDLEEYLWDKGIYAKTIGHLSNDNDRVIVNDYERKFLTKPCPDEITKVLL